MPDGGRFDGALGVLAALHVLLAVHAAGLELPLALEAIDFTDEEGTLVGLLGSEALAGTLAPAGLHEGQLAEAWRARRRLPGISSSTSSKGPCSSAPAPRSAS